MRLERFRSLLLTSVCLVPAIGALAELPLQNDRDRALYAIGTVVGRGLGGLDLSPEEFERVAAGIHDAALAREIRFSNFEMQDEIRAFQGERRERAIQAEIQRTRDFLAGVASEAGVRRTDTGLLFQDLESGGGPTPGARDRVRVHYEGRLRSGELFDSTTVRGSAALFPLDGVIPCWTEGLTLMRVGGRARIVCPPEIAYGESGYPPNVPPNAPLDFHVELLEIVTGQGAP